MSPVGYQEAVNVSAGAGMGMENKLGACDSTEDSKAMDERPGSTSLSMLHHAYTPSRMLAM